MRLDDAMRLCRLIREYKRGLARNASLLRCVIRLLDTCPDDHALRESVLDTLELASADATAANVALWLAAREPHKPLKDDTVDE